MRPTNRKQGVNYSWGVKAPQGGRDIPHGSSWGFFIGMGGGLFGGEWGGFNPCLEVVC